MEDELAKLLSKMGQSQGQGQSQGGKAGGGKAGAGMDANSIQGHAERLWKFLDNLAENDPEEYQNFLKKQAEAAGMEGKSPFTPKEHPVLVVICSTPSAVLRSDREGQKDNQKQVALLVFDDKSSKKGEKEEEELLSAFDQVDMGFKLKRKVHEEKSVEGLPSSTTGYIVVDVLAKSNVVEYLLEDKQERARDLDTFVNMLMHWSQRASVLGSALNPGRKVLILRKRLPTSMRNREAAQGTSASALPESILGQIAQMGVSTRGDSSKAQKKAPTSVKDPKSQPLIREISTTRSTPPCCIVGHEIMHSESSGEMKVKASLGKDVKVKDLEIHLKENLLVFSCADCSDYEVKVERNTGAPASATNYSAKYSRSSHRLTVKLV